MVAYKKFEFDNFVVEDDDVNVIETVDTELDISSEELTTSEVETIFEPEPEPEPEIEPVIEVVTYSEEEMSAAKVQAEQIGYDKGYQAKCEESDSAITTLLSNIDNKLFEVIASREQVQHELEQDFLALNRSVLQKLLPELSNEHATEILNRFLEKNFANFRAEPKLSFYFNPEIASAMQQQIAKLARLQDFEGKISLHKDSSLALADCRIEWENGGVGRSSDKLLEKVNNLLEEKPTEN